nr:McrC family protein [Ensifer sp. Root31]
MPKHSGGADELGRARRLLIRMISEALNLTPRVGGSASIEAFDLPMTEWLAAHFLERALELARPCPRQAYQLVQTREPFLRGRLDVARQIRAAASGGHFFHITHDQFSLDRPENRLIRSAIEHVARRTTLNANWRLARELSILFSDIPESQDVGADFRRWVCTGCRSRLRGYQGFSMLFPMERLFERYVLASLRMTAPRTFEILPQHGALHLCSQDGDDWFRMKPDILIKSGDRRWIIDAKWKRLTADRENNHGLSQADFYQLFADGQSISRAMARCISFTRPSTIFPNSALPSNSRMEQRSAPYSFLSS